MAMTRKTKILLAVLVLLAVAATALFIHVTRDPLAEFKAADVVQTGPAEQKYMDHVLVLIEKNDMRGLYKEVINMDAAVFSDLFMQGLFKEQDFCPAKVVGATRKRISRNQNNIDIHVKSEKPKKVYCFSLLGIKDSLKIRNILESEDKRFKNK